jgi:predicted DCC family thiol-disulfide oxidoreductase YuxK
MSTEMNDACGSTSDGKMSIVYDGQCPFCSNYVRLFDLRKKVGVVELVDARKNSPMAQTLAGLGYDLNEGMAVIYCDKIYYGPEAVIFLSSMSTDQRRWTARFLGILLRNRDRAAVIYPFMKACRRITLALLGRPPLNLTVNLPDAPRSTHR